jgi:hypothetical protein
VKLAAESDPPPPPQAASSAAAAKAQSRSLIIRSPESVFRSCVQRIHERDLSVSRTARPRILKSRSIFLMIVILFDVKMLNFVNFHDIAGSSGHAP